MSGETLITLIGNLTSDPELRYTPSGVPVANFTIASTPRSYDRNAGEWKDGDTMFLDCTVWRDAAEHAAESLTKGMRAIAYGYLKTRSYQTRDGDKRTVFQLDVEEIGPSLRNATAQVTRAGSQGAGWSKDTKPQGADPWAGAQEEAPF